MKRLYVSLMLFMAFMLSAYAEPPLGPDAMAGKNMAVIQTEDTALRISKIDGQKTAKSLEWTWSPTQIEVTPDSHTVGVSYYQGEKPTTRCYFRLVVEAGHVYTVKDDVVTRGIGADTWSLARMWIVDQTTVRTVGELYESYNEPVTPANRAFGQSIFFLWAAPPEGDWVIMSRDRRTLNAMTQSGPNQREQEVINIYVFDMPSIDTSDDFLNFAKDRLRTHYSDQKRFQDRKESVELVPGRKDPCVRYHLTVVDAHEDVDKAGHTLGHIALYDHGFICRLPNNKNLGLDFIYGINSYTPLKNDDLSDRAKKLFSQLKF